jgi:hypothetical protein
LAFYGLAADAKYDFSLFFEFAKLLYLTVDIKAGKNAGSVKIVKQLAAKLQIQLAAKPIQSLSEYGWFVP